jgi:hypothetical protein
MPVVGTLSPGLKGPVGISRASEQGTMMILLTLQFSINDSVALVPCFSAKTV